MRVLFLVGVLLVVTAILFFSSAFILEEGKQAVVTQFKRPVKFVDTPGLKFKVPFMQAVEYFEKKILPWDGAPENMQTKDTMLHHKLAQGRFSPDDENRRELKISAIALAGTMRLKSVAT